MRRNVHCNFLGHMLIVSSRGLILAARLKALGVDYVIIDENEKYGDNWAKRYDCLRFHVPLGFCQTPYLRE